MTDAPSSLPQLLTVREVAERLGISSRSVWSMLSNGRLTGLRLGAKTIRIEAAELERFVAAARIGQAMAS